MDSRTSIDRIGQGGIVGNDTAGLRLERAVVAHGVGKELAGAPVGIGVGRFVIEDIEAAEVFTMAVPSVMPSCWALFRLNVNCPFGAVVGVGKDETAAGIGVGCGLMVPLRVRRLLAV